MKYILHACCLSAMIFCCLSANSQTWKWGKQGVCSINDCEGMFVAADPSGNAYAVGVIYDAPYYGTAYHTIFGPDTVNCASAGGAQTVIFSTDSNGNYRWALGTNAQQVIPYGVVADSFGHVYVYGSFSNGPIIGRVVPPFNFGGDTLNVYTTTKNHYFLSKLDSAGHAIWLKDIAPQSGSGTFSFSGGLSIDGRGNVFISGEFDDSVISIGGHVLTKTDTGANTSDVFVAAFDSSGTPFWVRHFGGDSIQVVYTQTTSRNGDTYLSGYYFSHQIVFGPDTMQHAAGVTDPRVYIVKYDFYGNEQWAITSSGTNLPTLSAMANDISGNAYLVGGINSGSLSFGSVSFGGTRNFILKVAPDGTANWGVTVPGSYLNINYGIAIDNCNNIWVTTGEGGLSWGTPDNMYVTEYNTSGSYITQLTTLSGGDDNAGIAVDNFGHLFVTGDVAYNMVVGSDTLTIPTYMWESFFLLNASYPYSFCGVPPLLPLTTANVSHAPETVNIFPNPATDECTLQLNAPLSADARVTLYDITGHFIMALPLQSATTTFSVAGLSQGTYLCRIHNGNSNEQVQRLVIIK